MAQTTLTVQAGIVKSVNEKGVRLVGADSWLNYSKFAAEIMPCEPGAPVEVAVDAQGFIRRLTVLDTPESNMTHVEARETALGGAVLSKDLQIARAVALKAAVDFASGRELTSKDVTCLAERWEAWLIRP